MKKKFLSVMCAALTMLLASQSLVFADELSGEISGEISKDWLGQPYEAAVEALMEAEIVTGDVDGLFHPTDNLSRAQACKIVIATVNPPAAELTGTATQSVPSAGFTDLEGYNWAAPYINYAALNGIVNGYPDGTFKPGDDVTVAELAAMLVRASGIPESELTGTWPDNYVNKAAEKGFYDATGLVTETGAYAGAMKAEKWMAAWLTYNAKALIEAANAPEDEPQGTDKDKAEGIPDIEGMTYASGSFDKDITTFNGKPLAKNVIVYTYGIEKDYAKGMEFSDKVSDYRQDTVYKFKGVATKAWYKLENGEITEMVVPMDTGFTGKAYAVINGRAQTLNYDNSSVNALETLTATKEITWFARKAYSGNLPSQAEINASIANGDLYEITLNSGEITNITNDPAQKKGRMFAEISGSGWVTVTDKDSSRSLVEIGASWYELKENASVYVLNSDRDAFESGKASLIRKGDRVRLFDISDDDDISADIVILERN